MQYHFIGEIFYFFVVRYPFVACFCVGYACFNPFRARSRFVGKSIYRNFYLGIFAEKTSADFGSHRSLSMHSFGKRKSEFGKTHSYRKASRKSHYRKPTIANCECFWRNAFGFFAKNSSLDSPKLRSIRLQSFFENQFRKKIEYYVCFDETFGVVFPVVSVFFLHPSWEKN